ncbi:MAG: terpene cyclase/mutase family protein [Phycisphaerae bacterium]|jgi:hypothetical protein|nr:terpene cyclase/mutase family protein [Phycisphaerae bacterium]
MNHRWKPLLTAGVLVGTLLAGSMFGLAESDSTDAPTTASAHDTEQIDEAPELTERTEKAIDRGLKFLASIQNDDGSWSRKDGEYSVANTALALMAFMVQAQFPGEGDYGDKLDKGLDYLIRESKASADGYLGTNMYAHGLATLALSEVWGMCSVEKDDDVLRALKRAVEVIRRAQTLQGGWRYNPRPTEDDVSVTVTQVVALASARQAGIVVPDTTIDKAIDYITSCWHKESGGFRYMPHRTNPKFPRSAGAVYALQLSGRRDAEQVAAGLRYLREQPEEVFRRSDWYYYGHYYAIQAMVQAGDDAYRAWYPKIRNALLAKQKDDGAWQGGEGGRPQSTAMAIIVLGTPYRYIPVYQR